LKRLVAKGSIWHRFIGVHGRETRNVYLGLVCRLIGNSKIFINAFDYTPARKGFGYEASGKKPTNLSRKYVCNLFSAIIWRNI
jgi:hypothetical protein